MTQEKIQWQPLVEMAIVLVTILGSTIPLYLHTDSKMEASSARTQAVLEGIRQDMKDFHGRLCAIEERNKK
jgi:hypothetical protein